MTLTFLNNRHGVHPVPQGQGQELSPREKMIHRRAVEVAVWGMPLVGTRGVLNDTRRDLGGDWNDVVFLSKPFPDRQQPDSLSRIVCLRYFAALNRLMIWLVVTTSLALNS